MDFEIAVRPETLEPGKKSTAIPGKIWITTSSGSIPEQEWWDFPIPILGWWCHALIDLLTAPERPAGLDFMDGPFTVWLQSGDKLTCTILVETRHAEGSAKEIIGSARISDIRTALLEATDRVLAFCAEKCWLSDDIKRVQRSLEDLRAQQLPG